MGRIEMVAHEREIAALRNELLLKPGCERAAYLLFGEARIAMDPWGGRSNRRLILHEVIPVPNEDFLVTARNRVTWSTRSFVRLLERAEKEGWIVGVAHNHLAPVGFSEQDDRNEPDLLDLAQNRNGLETELVSVLLDGADDVIGRVWNADFEVTSVERLVIVGERLAIHTRRRGESTRRDEAFARQALAFGSALELLMAELRVGIVGLVGTGSAVAALLARHGPGFVALIDKDRVEKTNLNRVHQATWRDAELGSPKVNVVAEWMRSVDLGTEVATFEGWADDPACRDALRSCDLIFGCTDDHHGRLLLNRLAYYYHVPVIDLGLAIEAGPGDPPRLMCCDGRMSVIAAGRPCLLCRGVIRPELARAEALQRSSPAEYARQKAEAYVLGEGDPAPAVVNFTTEVAIMGMNELIHRIQGFRGDEGSRWHTIRKFDLVADLTPRIKSREQCAVCDRRAHQGRGDADPFLGRA